MNRSVALFLACSMLLAAPLRAEERQDKLSAKVAAMVRKGDIHGAEIELKRAIVAEPERGDLRFALGNLHLQSGQLIEAEQDYKLAEQRGVDPNQILPQRASLWLTQGEDDRLLREIQPNESMPADLLARIFALRATAEIALSKIDDAQASLDAAIRTGAGGQHDVRMALAQLRLATNQPAAADTLLNETLANQPNDLEALMLKAVIRLRSQDLPGAIQFYDQALAARPDAVLPRIARAVTLVSQGRAAEAQRDVDLLVKALPKNPQVRLLQAQLLARRDQIADAWETLRPVIPDLSHNVAAQILAGRLNLQRDNLAQARDFASVAVTLDPDNSQAVRLLAAIEMKGRASGKAIGLLEAFLRKQPNDPGVLADLGEIYGNVGQTERAAQLFEQAASQLPDDHNLQFALAVSQIKAGHLSAAIPLLEGGVAGHEARAGAVLTALFLSQGRIAEARQQAKSYQAMDPDNPLGDVLLGRVELAAGNVAAAQSSFQAGLNRNGDFLPAIQGLALCSQRQGDFDKAIGLLQAAVARRPQDESARIALIGAAIAGPDAAKANEITETAAIAMPSSLPVQTARIEYLLRTRHIDDALRAAEKLPDLFSSQPATLALLAKVQFFATKYSDAIATLHVMAQKAPGAGDLQLAELLIQLGRRVEGRIVLDNAVKRTPGLFPLWELRVDDEMRSHGIAAALELAQSARRISAPMADMLTADLLFRSRRYQEAIKPYLAAYQSSGGATLRIILQRLVTTEQRAGHAEEAQKLLLDWLDHHPDDLTMRQSLADLYFTQRKPIEAMSHYSKVLQNDPNNVGALNNLALLHGERQEIDKALAEARQARLYAPASAPVADTLGWLLVQSGAIAEALPLLRGAHESSQGIDPTFGYHYATALARNGDRNNALELLQRLVKGPAFADQAQAAALLKSLEQNKNASQSRQ